MSLELITQGNEILGRIAQPVKDIANPEVQQFIDDLIKACFEYDGVGIAAPQVGVSKRIFIMAARPNPRYPNSPEMDVEAVINPELIHESEEGEIDWEGCLSVPGKRGLVYRPQKILVSYYNREGERIQTEFEDFFARLFLHEFDHLNGILYPRRMAKGEPLISYEEYIALMQKQADEEE